MRFDTDSQLSGSERQKSKQYELKLILFGAPRFPCLYPYPEAQVRKWVVCEGKPWPKEGLIDGAYPYVVSVQGEFRFPQEPLSRGFLYHPQLNNGREVVAAGIFRSLSGEINYIDDDSGHYQPDNFCVNIALQVMKLWELPVSKNLKRGERLV